MDATGRAVLEELRARVEAGDEGGIYGDRAEALRDIDALLAHPSPGGVRWLLAPTGNLQELSIECGWGMEFNQLAAKLEGAFNL